MKIFFKDYYVDLDIIPARTVMANIAPYLAAHRNNSMLTTGTINRWIAPGNANSLNCHAVMVDSF